MIMKLFHSGYEIIKSPDIKRGRKNADFGQGFYLSDNGEFAGKWLRESKDKTAIVNEYELDTNGLSVRKFERGIEWFEYILANRAGLEDSLKNVDIVIGPIANDTLYDTFGMITSGILEKEESLKLLMVGPCYYQIVIKSNKALSNLKWVKADEIDNSKLRQFASDLKNEEADYQQKIADVMEDL